MKRKILRKYLTSIIFLTCSLLIGSIETASATPSVVRLTLANKMALLLSEEHSLPFVTLQMVIDGGARQDPQGKEGLANLTAKGLLLGTSKQDVETINETLDFMGASLNASANRDYASFSLRVLKKDLGKGLGLFADTIRRPVFPQEEMKKEANKIMGAIKSSEEDPGEVAEKAFYKIVFRNSPYGHPVEGTKESIPGIIKDDVLRFYNNFYRPNNAILVVVGDITLEEVKGQIIPLFADWIEGPIPRAAIKQNEFGKGETVRINRDLAQANIIIGEIGVPRSSPDYYALSVMNYILGGGGFGSRLMEEVRIKRGLAYAVDSFFAPMKYQGSFQVVLQTKNASAREAIALVLEQIERIRREPVTSEAVERAQNYLSGSFPMRFDTQSKLARFLSQVEYYGLGLDYPEKYPSLIKSISREDVLRVAQKYLHPDQAIQVIVGNLKEAGFSTPNP